MRQQSFCKVQPLGELAHLRLESLQAILEIRHAYAKDRGIGEITPAVMDTARSELGLEEM